MTIFCTFGAKFEANMKRFALVLVAIFLAFSGCAQKNAKFTEEDAKQFYRTLVGDYSLIDEKDSLVATVHFTPIWEGYGRRFQWLYVEASRGEEVVYQRILEVRPKNEKVFRVIVHNLKHPEQFVGKWGTRNYFDGFTMSILKGKTKLTFIKTSDFSYQMSGFKHTPALKGCFPKGDSFHLKFVQQDERFYIKRLPARTTRIRGYQGLKELTDGPIG